MQQAKLLANLVEQAFANNESIEQAETILAKLLRRVETGSSEYKALIAYAAWRLVGDYVRSNRLKPFGDEEVGVHKIDKRFTPQRRTPEEQAEHLTEMGEKVFQFRLFDNTSIWKATREKLDMDLSMRRRHLIGCQQRYEFLLSVRDRLQPGQSVGDAGITNEELWGLYNDAVKAGQA